MAIKNTLLLFFLALFTGLQAQVFQVDTIVKTGPLDKRINLVYLADGYIASEQGKFINDVLATNDKLFASIPFSHYKDYFNVFAIKVVSDESGIKHASSAGDCPGTGVHPVSNPNNYFGTRFDVSGIHRLVVPDSFAKLNTVLATNFPLYDQVLVLGNTSFYGGSGGTFATSTTHFNAAEIMIHEIGHSFAGLADEYWAGAIYAGEKPNMTAQSNTALVKWKNWIGMPGIGVFPHSGGPGWYKPTTGGTCKMEALGPAFCDVCKETFTERIHGLVAPVDHFHPANTATLNINSTTGFKTELVRPIPNTLEQKWFLDNVDQSVAVDTFTILAGSITNGNHTLRTSIVDNTPLSRQDNHISLHTYTILWNLSMLTGISAPEVFRASLKIFPNPFAENLMLQYKLDKPAAVSVVLTAADGKTIVLLREKKQASGTHTASISTSRYQLAAGTYTISFNINDFTVAKELLKLQ